MGAVSDLQERRFNGKLQRFSDDLAVTAVAQPLITPDGERVTLTVINSGTTVVWLRVGRPGAAGLGFRLPASGGGMTFDAEMDPDLIVEAMYLITPAGTSTVEIVGSRRYALLGGN